MLYQRYLEQYKILPGHLVDPGRFETGGAGRVEATETGGRLA